MPDTKRADFKKWARRDTWHLAEGAMLLLGLEPFELTADWGETHKEPDFVEIYDTTRRSPRLAAGEVSPPHFLAWAREKGYAIPPELEKGVNRFHPKGGITPGGGYGSRPLRAPIEQPAPADFEKWARRDWWGVEEFAMLLLGFEPFDTRRHSWPRAPGFDDLYETLRRSDPLPGKPTQYLAWAREKKYPVPPELEEAVNRFHPKTEGKPRGDADGPKWPWGSYENELLCHLAAAADRFWKNYDPSHPEKAPLNKTVAGWLEDQGVRQRNAEIIATILRAEDVPPGPRKK